MKKAIESALALLLLVVTATACGGRTASPAAPTAVPVVQATAVQQPTVPPAVQATAVPVAKATAALQPTVPPAPRATAVVATATRPLATATPAPVEEETLSLDSRNAGLDQLKSYRARWQAEWRVTEAGKTESLSWDFTEEYTAELQARHVVWRAQTASSESTAVEIWRIGDTTYVRGGEPGKPPACFAMSSDDQLQTITRGIFDPRVLGGLEGARYVGSETVNGIKTKHYKYDEKAFSVAGTTKVSGDIWVAADGGYTVKDTVSWIGSAGLLGASATSTGEGKWTWELTEVNRPLTITPPADCATPEAGLPVLSDATEKSSVGPVLMYKSATAMADAVKFYKEQMAAAGWTLASENTLGGQLSQLTFKKADRQAQVMISADGAAIRVMITTEK